MGFKEFVDNHVEKTTKFKTAENLITRSKPLRYVWICFGAVALVFLMITLINNSFEIWAFLLLTVFFGFVATYFAGGIIRMRYRRKFNGTFTGNIDIAELLVFLTEHLQQIHPNFHEWSYFWFDRIYYAT